jgi:hypothetical protein
MAAIPKHRKRYRLGGELAFRDVDGIEQRLPAGAELGPKALAGFSEGEIAAHLSTGRFQEIAPSGGRQGLAARARSVIVRERPRCGVHLAQSGSLAAGCPSRRGRKGGRSPTGAEIPATWERLLFERGVA